MRRRAVVLLVSTSALACGLLVPADLVERECRDEVSGFVDGAGVEVCFDGTPVVSSSQAKDGPLSVCLAVGDEARPCGPGGACGAGERCSCGRCTTRPCRTSTECEVGDVCQANRCTSACTGDRDCGEGERCSAGGCARPCAASVDCPFGESCSTFDGTCVVKLCGEVVGCGGSDVCVPQQVVADLREPHAMLWREGRVAFFEVRGGPAAPNDCSIFRARVDGDRRWVVDPTTAVLEPAADDAGCLGAPSVVAAGEGLVLVASRGDGSGIVRAFSEDGVVFTREDALVLEPASSWEAGWVGSPGVAAWSGGIVMLYEGGRGAGIGMARLESSGAERMSEGPWLAPSTFEDPVLWRHVERVGSPFAVGREGVLLVYLTVRGVEGSDAVTQAGEVYVADANDSIGLASTRDLRGVEVFAGGPVLARRTNLRAYLGEAEPSVLFDAGASWLVYASSDATGAQRTGLGMATVP
jgi:hypothetical protein